MASKSYPYLPGFESPATKPVVTGDIRRLAIELSRIRNGSDFDSLLAGLLEDTALMEYAATLPGDTRDEADTVAMIAMAMVNLLPEIAKMPIGAPEKESGRFGDEGLTVSDLVEFINKTLYSKYKFRCPNTVLRVAVDCPTRTSSTSEIVARMAVILRNPQLMILLRDKSFELIEKIWAAREQISQLLQGIGD